TVTDLADDGVCRDTRGGITAATLGSHDQVGEITRNRFEHARILHQGLGTSHAFLDGSRCPTGILDVHHEQGFVGAFLDECSNVCNATHFATVAYQDSAIHIWTCCKASQGIDGVLYIIKSL